MRTSFVLYVRIIWIGIKKNLIRVPLLAQWKGGESFGELIFWRNIFRKIFSWKNVAFGQKRIRRAALLDGQITSGNWQNISWKITRAYSEAFRFLASGSIQCSFANETLYPLRVRDELRQIFAAILRMYRMCV